MKSELIKGDSFCREISVLPSQATWISEDYDVLGKFAKVVKPLLKYRRFISNDRYIEKPANSK